MFLCENCHTHGDDICELEKLSQSYGKCEDCGQVRICVDCKWHHRAPIEEVITEK